MRVFENDGNFRNLLFGSPNIARVREKQYTNDYHVRANILDMQKCKRLDSFSESIHSIDQASFLRKIIIRTLSYFSKKSNTNFDRYFFSACELKSADHAICR